MRLAVVLFEIMQDIDKRARYTCLVFARNFQFVGDGVFDV